MFVDFNVLLSLFGCWVLWGLSIYLVGWCWGGFGGCLYVCVWLLLSFPRLFAFLPKRVIFFFLGQNWPGGIEMLIVLLCGCCICIGWVGGLIVVVVKKELAHLSWGCFVSLYFYFFVLVVVWWLVCFGFLFWFGLWCVGFWGLSVNQLVSLVFVVFWSFGVLCVFFAF